MEFMKVKREFKSIALKLCNFHNTVHSFDFGAYEFCAVNLRKRAWVVQNVGLDFVSSETEYL
jgi:hypothetical protein